jgi:hypothetical protein
MEVDAGVVNRIVVNEYTGQIDCGIWCGSGYSYDGNSGIMEFDIGLIDDLFVSGLIEAQLCLTAKEGYLSDGRCISLYGIQDASENGIIERVDLDTEEYIDEICEDLQPGSVVTIDVTSFLEHDLFDPYQTTLSGFVIKGNSYPWNWFPDGIEFFDHTDPLNAPRLTVRNIDSDGDNIPAVQDNCPYDYNPQQEDSYPPGGNGIGDACDCEGNFSCSMDQDVDGSDAATFKADFGRSAILHPCITGDTCHGDFSCDGDVDGTDASLFKHDFGRSSFQNPCPACVAGVEWCSY